VKNTIFQKLDVVLSSGERAEGAYSIGSVANSRPQLLSQWSSGLEWTGPVTEVESF
jgi:hypothetical protein